MLGCDCESLFSKSTWVRAIVSACTPTLESHLNNAILQGQSDGIKQQGRASAHRHQPNEMVSNSVDSTTRRFPTLSPVPIRTRR